MNPMTWDAPYLVVVGALFVIVMFRANGTYWVGRLLQRGALHTRLARVMTTPGYARAVDKLTSWGPPLVTVSFLTIGFQTLVNLASGATAMPLRRDLPAVSLGCILWAFIYGTVGFAGFEALALLWERNPVAAVSLGVLAALGLATFIAWRVRVARRTPASAPDEATPVQQAEGPASQ